jgi:hypothetical protein
MPTAAESVPFTVLQTPVKPCVNWQEPDWGLQKPEAAVKLQYDSLI